MTKRTAQKTAECLTDVEEPRRRTRLHMERGAVTDNSDAVGKTVLALLNISLASELACVLRYRQHYFMATGIHAQAVAAEFLEHATEEQEHANRIAHRITQLGGEPDFTPEEQATRSHGEHVEGADLEDMIREDLAAERVAIESYGVMIRYLDENDPTTRRMLEEILAAEEEHAKGLQALMQKASKTQRRTP